MPISLKAMRVDRNLTQAQAAEMMSEEAGRPITCDIISNWERYITYPDVRDVSVIEKVYKCSYNDIKFLPA